MKFILLSSRCNLVRVLKFAIEHLDYRALDATYKASWRLGLLGIPRFDLHPEPQWLHGVHPRISTLEGAMEGVEVGVEVILGGGAEAFQAGH